MTIRIERIERRESEGHYSWHISMKGLQGEGVYCQLATGIDGYGLSVAANSFKMTWTELLSPDRFHAHLGLSAEQVAHRVAACLVCIGWGPEVYNDRDAITRGRSVTASIVTTSLLGPVDI